MRKQRRSYLDRRCSLSSRLGGAMGSGWGKPGAPTEAAGGSVYLWCEPSGCVVEQSKSAGQSRSAGQPVSI